MRVSPPCCGVAALHRCLRAHYAVASAPRQPMKILGILNITSESFSDGGKYLAPEAALAHADRLLADGADILDIGAASSHPDAGPVPPQTEIARLAAIVPTLHDTGASVSI